MGFWDPDEDLPRDFAGRRAALISSLSAPKERAVVADQRTVSLVDGLADRVRGFIRDERATYAEYHAALGYLIQAAEAGEIPLLVAVFAESTVETVNAGGGATDSAIEGPYYKPGAPWLQRPYALPMRPGEPGDPLLFSGRVESGRRRAAGRRRGGHAAVHQRRHVLVLHPAAPRGVRAAGLAAHRRRGGVRRPHHPPGAVPDPPRGPGG